MSKPYKRSGSRFWWIAPFIEGRQCHQSSGHTEYEDAERKLKILEGRIAANAPITAKTDRESFATLLELVVKDYRTKRRRSLYTIECRIEKNIMPALGYLPTTKVSSETITDYVRSRQDAGAADATVNGELAVIKRAFKLGSRYGIVSAVPYIELLPADNARQGFFTEGNFQSVMRHAKDNPLLRDILTVLFYTGWRISSVLRLEWSQVDLKHGSLRLWSQQTKNRKATICPLAPFPELRRALESRWAERKDLIPYVFHRDGKPVKNIKNSWVALRTEAGVPGRLLHDMRRSAVRRLVQMGYPRHFIKAMVGFKTDSIFERYAIVTEDDVMKFADGRGNVDVKNG